MRKHLVKGLIAVACFTLVSLPLPVSAQTSNIGLSIGTSSPTVTRGSGVAVYALVTNSGLTKLKTNVSVSALSPCGLETSLGEVRVSLDPGKAVALSVYYPVAADACTGMYAVTISAESSSGKGPDKSAATISPSATAYLEVK